MIESEFSHESMWGISANQASTAVRHLLLP